MVRRPAVRGYETRPELRGKVRQPRLVLPGDFSRRTPGEVEELERAARDERSSKLREVYEAVGLRVAAHGDETLVIGWSFGERVLPGVTVSELGRMFAPDEPR